MQKRDGGSPSHRVVVSEHGLMIHGDAAHNDMMRSDEPYVAALAESLSACWIRVMLSPFSRIRPGSGSTRSATLNAGHKT